VLKNDHHACNGAQDLDILKPLGRLPHCGCSSMA
jgi:hypothetical protein